LSTALVVALVNRYVWDLYFEQKRQTLIRIFFAKLSAGSFFWSRFFCPEFWLSRRSAIERASRGSGVIAIIVGFAGQNLFCRDHRRHIDPN